MTTDIIEMSQAIIDDFWENDEQLKERIKIREVNNDD